MKNLLILMITAIVTLGIVSCGSGDVIPEMKDFMKGFGSKDKVTTALKKHAGPGTDTQGMEEYDLVNPQIVKAEKVDDMMVYTIKAKAGVTTREFDIKWFNGKIAYVVDKGTPR
ncbi:MAG: hypothetical protein GY754_05020 [bacterium]|nr:hypothetical protein [bacterium]